jgi:hypothetical protein
MIKKLVYKVPYGISVLEEKTNEVSKVPDRANMLV